MSVLNENQLLGAPPSASYQIQRSLRFNSSDSAYLSRTPAAAGNRKTWTWSGWVKRGVPAQTLPTLFGTFDSNGTTNGHILYFDADKIVLGYCPSGAFTIQSATTAVFRDYSAWYHIVAAFDTTQAVASERYKLYVNGVQQTVTNLLWAQNTDYLINFNALPHSIGRAGAYAGSVYLSAYLAEINFIDGQALTPSSFGQTDANGEWQPKAYTGTYGTNGFKLNFADNSAATAAALGKDTSGNGNNWTPNNLSVTAGAGNDSLVDTPTSYGTDTGFGGEARGNYCTLNPLDCSPNLTVSDGSLVVTNPASTWRTVRGTIGITSGKWYWEVTATNSSGGLLVVGIAESSTDLGNYPTSPGGRSWQYNGTLSGAGATGSAAAFATGDILGFALDISAGTLALYKNGVLQSGSFTGLTSGPYFPAMGVYTPGVCTVNFGQRPFAYPAPAGFKALCDTNLPAPVVAKPSTVMDVKLYTGNGSTQTISGLGFSPDLVWIKDRTASADHQWYDSVRGTGLRINSNLTNAEADSTPYGVTTFGATSFTVADLTNGGYKVNGSSTGQTYAAWCWDAGSSTVTNTAGTISSQVRANASAGFSVVTYTGTGTNGATVGHGLGVSPGMVIVKSRSGAYEWPVYHSSLSAGNNLFLHLTNAQNSVSGTVTAGGVGGVSSTTFTCTQGVSNINNTNATSATYVAYCFAPVAGYSAFGSYTGNGSADGPFVYTGFRPRWVMIKIAGASGGHWGIFDSARSGYNPQNDGLIASGATVENNNYAATDVDLLSNGFKIRVTPRLNASGESIVYAAFAEFPFQYARAR